MKVCETCGREIATIDGENQCLTCEEGAFYHGFEEMMAKARQRRKERDQVMRDRGLVKVKGALGGTYWE